MAMEQRLVANIAQKQQQRQIMSPRILQSLDILAIATVDLEARINEMLGENPVLELARPERVAPDENRPEDPHGQENRQEADGLERSIEFLENFDPSFNEDSGWKPPNRLIGEEDAKMSAMANTPAASEGLSDYLLRQLAAFELSREMRDACIQLIEALTPDGFLEVAPEDVVSDRSLAEEERIALARNAHNIIKNLDPPGIGAKNPGEAMLLQISPDDIDYQLFKTLLIDYWQDLLRNGFRKIASKTPYSIEEIAYARDQLTTLDPYPGRFYTESSAEIVKPDVVIEESDALNGEWEVRVLEDRTPALRVSTRYMRMLAKSKDAETQKYLKDKIQRAKDFIDGLKQRESTLARVTKAIVKRQKGFFEVGVAGLKPLVMQEVADDVEMAVSTISRTVANKYAETPHGILPLKYFFVQQASSDDDEDASSIQVQEHLKTLVDDENPKKPLSDDALVKMLKERFGTTIARRTVAKYREKLSIPNSRQRKAHV